MEAFPLVDVIVSTNRSSPYLAEALHSLKEQTWPHWRLIVVDDGSPDPAFLQDAVAQFADAEIVRQEPSGLPAARNTGLRHAQGDLVAFLDDDDVWEPEKLELQVSAWLAEPEHVAIYCAGTFIGPDGEPLEEKGWQAEPASQDQFLSGATPMPRIVTLLVRRDACVAIGGFNESYSLAEDTEFTLRLVLYGAFTALPQRLVRYRRHPSNMSATPPRAARKAGERLLGEQIAAAQSRQDLRTASLLRENLQRFHRFHADESAGAAIGAFRRRDWATARIELGWALSHQPRRTCTFLIQRVGDRVRRAVRRTHDRLGHGGSTVS